MNRYLELAAKVKTERIFMATPIPRSRSVPVACISCHREPVTAQESGEFPGWLELTCRSCGMKQYMRLEEWERWRGKPWPN